MVSDELDDEGRLVFFLHIFSYDSLDVKMDVYDLSPSKLGEIFPIGCLKKFRHHKFEAKLLYLT